MATPTQAEGQLLDITRVGLAQPETSDVKEPEPALPPKAPEVTKPAPPPPAPRPPVPRWILQVRTLDLMEVAGVLGLQVEGDRILPCPSCGDEAGAEVFQNKKEWLLWRCEACGARDRGNLDLASYALSGEKAGDLSDGGKALLRQWFADQGWCDGEDLDCGGDMDDVTE